MSNDDQALPAESIPADPVDHELQSLRAHMTALEHRGRAGANWFYWVAGLSIVNSVIMLVGGGIHFVVGLGITQFADGIAHGVAQQNPDAATIAKSVAFGFDLVAAAVVAGFGWLSNKRFSAIFAVGMVLYFCDGLLFLLFPDWMSAAFHVFALFQMWAGFQAYRQINGLLKAPPV